MNTEYLSAAYALKCEKRIKTVLAEWKQIRKETNKYYNEDIPDYLLSLDEIDIKTKDQH